GPNRARAKGGRSGAIAGSGHREVARRLCARASASHRSCPFHCPRWGVAPLSAPSIAKTQVSFCQLPDTSGEIASTVSLLTDGDFGSCHSLAAARRRRDTEPE